MNAYHLSCIQRDALDSSSKIVTQLAVDTHPVLLEAKGTDDFKKKILTKLNQTLGNGYVQRLLKYNDTMHEKAFNKFKNIGCRRVGRNFEKIAGSINCAANHVRIQMEQASPAQIRSRIMSPIEHAAEALAKSLLDIRRALDHIGRAVVVVVNTQFEASGFAREPAGRIRHRILILLEEAGEILASPEPDLERTMDLLGRAVVETARLQFGRSSR